MALQIQSLTICLLDSNFRFHSSSWGKCAHLACFPCCIFSLMKLLQLLLYPFTLSANLCSLPPLIAVSVPRWHLTNSTSMLALHLCIFHSETASSPLCFPHMASLSPALFGQGDQWVAKISISPAYINFQNVQTFVLGQVQGGFPGVGKKMCSVTHPLWSVSALELLGRSVGLINL